LATNTPTSPCRHRRAIISYLTGKRNSENTDAFVRDIRARVVGVPEISTDGFHPYKNAIRDAFGNPIAQRETKPRRFD
jgi:transposase-like protein